MVWHYGMCANTFFSLPSLVQCQPGGLSNIKHNATAPVLFEIINIKLKRRRKIGRGTMGDNQVEERRNEMRSKIKISSVREKLKKKEGNLYYFYIVSCYDAIRLVITFFELVVDT